MHKRVYWLFNGLCSAFFCLSTKWLDGYIDKCSKVQIPYQVHINLGPLGPLDRSLIGQALVKIRTLDSYWCKMCRLRDNLTQLFAKGQDLYTFIFLSTDGQLEGLFTITYIQDPQPQWLYAWFYSAKNASEKKKDMFIGSR